MPIRMYTKLDLTFLGLKVPKVGVLIVEEQNQVLDKKHQTRLPGIIGWNLIRLSYDMFIKKYGTTDSTHLYFLKESILCCFPNCAFTIIPTYERPMHWEQPQK